MTFAGNPASKDWATTTDTQFAPLSHQSTMSLRSKSISNDPKTEAMPELSHSDKENYKHTAILMDKMGMDSSEPSRKKRLHSLEDGGLGRESEGVGNHAIITQPSEQRFIKVG